MTICLDNRGTVVDYCRAMVRQWFDSGWTMVGQWLQNCWKMV